jgi:glycosyltransferase involved in cell wall biosynthesis
LKASICFVSETGRFSRPLLDPSVRYRCFHPAEALSRVGHVVAVYSAREFLAEPCLDYDVYIFHRPSISNSVFLRVFEQLSILNRVLIAEYDDLIFGDETTALSSSIVKNNNATAAEAIETFSINASTLDLFDRISVSTRPLAAKVRAQRPNAKVVVTPNEVPDSILAPHLERRTPFKRRDVHTIGYMAGTKSHNSDFPIIRDVLHRILMENENFRLLVVGPVALPFAIASLPNVMTLDAVSYFQLPHLMSMCHTVVAPLETSAFNDCKSRVKFLEAALSGCRLVASPIPDMVEIGGKHMVLASSQEDWYEALCHPYDESDQLGRIQGNLNYLAQRTAIDSLKEVGEF